MSKHFNRAKVWGTIEDVEEKETENKKQYLDLKIRCGSAQYGDVLAFGRLWGKAVAGFKTAFKKGGNIALTGALAQYDGRGGRKTNFQFYRAETWDPKAGKHTYRRATFILVGEILSFDDGKLSLKVHLEAEGQQAKEEVFELWVPEKVCDIFNAPEAGAAIRVKGHIEQEEDDMGDVVRPARPVVSEMKRVKEGEETPF